MMKLLFPKAPHNIESSQDTESTPDVEEKLEHFRILIVGRASAGKTTLLQRVCNTTEYPDIVNGDGNEV